MLPDQERNLYLQRLRQLERLGLAMPFEYHLLNSRPCEIEVEQCAIELDCPVIDLPDEQTLFVVWVSLWAQRPDVRLYDFRFEPPWPDRNFQMLPNFAESCVGEAYVLPNQLSYPRADILNFRFGKTGWRLPSTRVEGVLCALSGTPIPREYQHGASIPVEVKFFGKSGQQLASTSVVLWADRWDERTVTRSTAKPAAAVDEADSGVDARPGVGRR